MRTLLPLLKSLTAQASEAPPHEEPQLVKLPCPVVSVQTEHFVKRVAPLVSESVGLLFCRKNQLKPRGEKPGQLRGPEEQTMFLREKQLQPRRKDEENEQKAKARRCHRKRNWDVEKESGYGLTSFAQFCVLSFEAISDRAASSGQNVPFPQVVVSRSNTQMSLSRQMCPLDAEFSQ